MTNFPSKLSEHKAEIRIPKGIGNNTNKMSKKKELRHETVSHS